MEGDRSRDLTARIRQRGEPPDLRHRGPHLTARIADNVFDQIPAYANAGREFQDAVTVVIGRIVDLVLQIFLEQRLATRHEIRDLVAICIPPVDQGITLEDLLTVFHISQNTLWWELHRVVDELELEDPRMSLELSHLGVEVITGLILGATSEYLRGDRVWLQRRDAERALIRGVLEVPPRSDEATRAAHALDLQLIGSWQCAVYEPAGEGFVVDTLASFLEGWRSRKRARGALAIDADVVVLFLQGTEAPPPPAGARAGMGSVHDGAQGMRTSHDEAREALDVARRRELVSVTAAEARLDRMILGSLSVPELAQGLLAPLAAEPPARRQMLLETLEAWLDEQGGATATARRLNLHVQSARYRIQQLREAFGDVLEDPEGRLQLHLAVKSLRIAPA
ncbi:MAG: helix-turn-helix domain-containing protein [Nitriliruptorales bacterium]|nr:helix-turn-helix domain-containing protein [Nitriliruptorales bacterium]